MKANREVVQLSSELQELKKEYDLLHSKYVSAEKRLQELEEGPKTGIGPSHFRKTLHALKEETEKLRSVYPLQDLLAAKELEVEKIGKALASVSEADPEFGSFDLKLKTHLEERETLRSLAAKADERFKRQILRIRTAGLMIPFEVQTEEPKRLEVSDGDGSENGQEAGAPRNPLFTLLPIL